MDVFEITGLLTGVSDEGVNYLQPADSYQNIVNGFIYRQVLQSRQGAGYFAPRLDPVVVVTNRRVYGIYEHVLPDSTTALLAFDANFLYKYNSATGVFDKVPFGGSLLLAGYAGFNITAKDHYISGVSYPTKENLPRFIFCGQGITAVGGAGGSNIFFYDGSTVQCFTNSDNGDYEAPIEGALVSAQYVTWFNERLNFLIPTIGAVEYYQGTLYSGIRTATGNGDKFGVPGAGLFLSDTYQTITGFALNGQVMIHNYNRMAYTMEKTRDAFNPYFGRSVAGVLGTNAKFSSVCWDESVRSIGKTGILNADGRKNLRIDNKIPNFTATQIEPNSFNYTYGGFDRLNNQFLWSYLQAGTEDLTQNRVLVGNYEENSWSVYDQHFTVFGQTDLGLNLTWDQIEEASGNESWAQWDTTEEFWDNIGIGLATQKTLAGDDNGFIYELNQDFDDYFTLITGVTPGTTTTLTVNATSAQPGDLVTIANVEGMIELNNFNTETSEQIGDLYEVISATATSIEIDVDSSFFTAYTLNTGSLSKTIAFSAQTIPFNPYRSIGRRCFVSYVEFLIDCNGGKLLVDVTADQQSSPFIRDVLLEPINDPEQVNEWVSLSVNQEANFLTFTLKQQSPAVQLRLTNFRIHCSPGGLTSG